MLPFESVSPLAESAVPPRSARATLPLYVEPMPEEALISYLARLAARYALSVNALALRAFAWKARDQSLSWERPPQSLLSRISEQTGVTTGQLRAMSFIGWQDTPQQIETSERLRTRRSDPQAQHGRLTHAVAICSACLREGSHPYLRLIWTLQWVAVCPYHETVLTTYCPRCTSALCLPSPASRKPFRADRCVRCGADPTCQDAPRAHPAVLALQTQLIQCKHHGAASLPHLGNVSWPLALAAADILLGIMLEPSGPNRSKRLQGRIERDFATAWTASSSGRPSRYDDLIRLAWILDRWPANLRAALTIRRSPHLRCLIDRCHQEHARLRPDLKELLRSAIPLPRIPRRSWRMWLIDLPQTSMQLRERAERERYKHRRLRLEVLAQLREGYSIPAVARAVGVQPHTIYHWLRTGARDGLEAMLERAPGRYALTNAQAAEIADWLAAFPPSTRPGAASLRARELIDEVVRRFTVTLSVHAAGRLIRKHAPRSAPRRRSRVREPGTRTGNPVHE